jgi:hypothetical protein
VIGDQHAPYQHNDALDFLKAIKKEFGITRVVNIGDEVDNHDISFHKSEKGLFSAGFELEAARDWLKDLEKIFPKMDLVDSNHGSLFFRRALDAGLPYEVIKPYNEIWGVSDKWVWKHDLTLKLPNKQLCYFHHGKSSNVAKVSQSLGMNVVQGHYHEKHIIEYWKSPAGRFWGMQTGCLIDNKSRAFAYNKNNLKEPILGSAVIVDSIPQLVPMILNKKSRWVGRLY